MARREMNSMSALMNGNGTQFGGGEKHSGGTEFKVMEATEGRVPAMPKIGKDSKSGGYSAKEQK